MILDESTDFYRLGLHKPFFVQQFLLLHLIFSSTSKKQKIYMTAIIGKWQFSNRILILKLKNSWTWKIKNFK